MCIRDRYVGDVLIQLGIPGPVSGFLPRLCAVVLRADWFDGTALCADDANSVHAERLYGGVALPIGAARAEKFLARATACDAFSTDHDSTLSRHLLGVRRFNVATALALEDRLEGLGLLLAHKLLASCVRLGSSPCGSGAVGVLLEHSSPIRQLTVPGLVVDLHG